MIGDVRWFQHGYYKAKFQSGFGGLLLSRPLLEGTLRRAVSALPNVVILDKTHVVGLASNSSRESSDRCPRSANGWFSRPSFTGP